MIDHDGHLVYHYNYYGTHHLLRSDRPVPLGTAQVRMRFVIDDGATSGVAELFIDGRSAGTMRLAETFPHFVAFQGPRCR